MARNPGTQVPVACMTPPELANSVAGVWHGAFRSVAGQGDRHFKRLRYLRQSSP